MDADAPPRPAGGRGEACAPAAAAERLAVKADSEEGAAAEPVLIPRTLQFSVPPHHHCHTGESLTQDGFGGFFAKFPAVVEIPSVRTPATGGGLTSLPESKPTWPPRGGGGGGSSASEDSGSDGGGASAPPHPPSPAAAALPATITATYASVQHLGAYEQARREQDLTGLSDWNGAALVGSYLLRLPRGALRGKRVLELGCGGAACGLVAANDLFAPAEVCLTDYSDDVLTLTRHNAGLQPATARRRLRVSKLDWAHACAQPIGQTPALGLFDVILGSELLYHAVDMDMLLECAVRHMRRPSRPVGAPGRPKVAGSSMPPNSQRPPGGGGAVSPGTNADDSDCGSGGDGPVFLLFSNVRDPDQFEAMVGRARSLWGLTVRFLDAASVLDWICLSGMACVVFADTEAAADTFSSALPGVKTLAASAVLADGQW